jgi:hypothetical protein
MQPANRQRGKELLRLALNNPRAEFREGQWETIEQLVYNISIFRENNKDFLITKLYRLKDVFADHSIETRFTDHSESLISVFFLVHA